MSEWWFTAVLVVLGILMNKHVPLPSPFAEWRRLLPSYDWLLIIGFIGFVGLRQFIYAAVNEQLTKDTAVFVGTAFIVCAAAPYKQPWRRGR